MTHNHRLGRNSRSDKLRSALKLRAVSYNIHQGISARRNRQTLAELREALRYLRLDVLLLQEVAGSGPGEVSDQLAQLADEMWPFQAYGRNAVFTKRFHGNAILSRLPIESFDNIDITLAPREPRGLLHAVVRDPESDTRIDLMSIHLGLLFKERLYQLERVAKHVREHIPSDAPIVLGGDFNDWQKAVSRVLTTQLSLEEAHYRLWSRYARSYPSYLPIFTLDRIYTRGCQVLEAHRLTGRPWRHLSDHLPLLTEIEIACLP